MNGIHGEVVLFCEEFSTKKEDHLLLSSFQERIAHCDFLTENQRKQFLEENTDLVLDKVLPSYASLAHKLAHLEGSGENDLGLAHFPKGKKYYTRLVSYNTGSDLSVPSLYKMISDKRSSDLAQMANLFSRDFHLAAKCSNFEFAQSDPVKMMTQLKDAFLHDFYEPIPSQDNLRMVSDALSPFVAPAFYFVAPMDNYQNHTIYYNPPKVSSNLGLFTTLAHEGYPGHLYQTMMTFHYGLSPIRSQLNFPGYTEGWATYVEMLSYHYAGIDSDLATVLQLNYSILLSLYASADIGIHYMGWDRDETLDFFRNFGIENGSVVSEIFQYIISEPGNYLKYYVGYLSFAELRQTFAQVPDKEFHKAVLTVGPAPFSIVEDYLKGIFTSSYDSAL